MAFALTNYKMYGQDVTEATGFTTIQWIEFDYTAANTDVALDISAPAGTFWTAAKANGTYGTLVATPCLANMVKVQTNAKALKEVISPEITHTWLRAAAAGATAYTLTYQPTLVNVDILMNSGTAPTAAKVIIGWFMKPGWTVMTGCGTTAGWTTQLT